MGIVTLFAPDSYRDAPTSLTALWPARVLGTGYQVLIAIGTAQMLCRVTLTKL